jgi:hypothetical protein
MATQEQAYEPVLDARGNEVVVPPDFEVTDTFREYMSYRVPAPNCPHYIHITEANAGYGNCERCDARPRL